MKAKIFTLGIILALSFNIASASNNFRILKLTKACGQVMDITIKIETLQEELDINTFEIFQRSKQEQKQSNLIDIKPFIKPEKELEEELF